jgi:hypothetical protein
MKLTFEALRIAPISNRRLKIWKNGDGPRVFNEQDNH